MIDSVLQTLQPFLDEWLSAFLDPKKRVFWGYLLAALLIAVVWLMLLKGRTFSASVRQFFDRESWWSKTARADYLLMLINTVFMVLLSPRLLGKAAVATGLFFALHDVFDGRPIIGAELPDWAIALGFTLFLFLFDDFARYWVHRWLHTIPALWAFHRVHHSATALNPLTVYRTHPMEAVLFSLRGALVQGISVALFFFFFGDRVTLITVLGAGAFNVAFNMLGSNLRHSPVSIGFWKPVERIFMSPAQHHIHHSTDPRHFDRNFGVALSLWDWLFKSHCFSEKDQCLSYGLGQQDGDNRHSLFSLYLTPFAEAWQALMPGRIRKWLPVFAKG